MKRRAPFGGWFKGNQQETKTQVGSLILRRIQIGDTPQRKRGEGSRASTKEKHPEGLGFGPSQTGRPLGPWTCSQGILLGSASIATTPFNTHQMSLQGGPNGKGIPILAQPGEEHLTREAFKKKCFTPLPHNFLWALGMATLLFYFFRYFRPDLPQKGIKHGCSLAVRVFWPVSQFYKNQRLQIQIQTVALARPLKTGNDLFPGRHGRFPKGNKKTDPT